MTRVAGQKSYKDHRWLQAVEFFLMGRPAQKAMEMAGFSANVARCQCGQLRRHPILRQTELSRITNIIVTKDYLKLKYLSLLGSKKISNLETLKTLEGLAKVCGYWQTEDNAGLPPNGNGTHIGDVNVTQIIGDSKVSADDIRERAKQAFERFAPRFGLSVIDSPRT